MAEKRELEKRNWELEEKVNRFLIVNETLLNRIDTLQKEKKENIILKNNEKTTVPVIDKAENNNAIEEDCDFNMSPKSIDLDKKFNNSILIKKEIQELMHNEKVTIMHYLINNK